MNLERRVPAGFVPVRVLSQRANTLVIEAQRGAERVVLRMDSGSGDEVLAELAVLAEIEHPRIARLVDFGPTPDGGHFVARTWAAGKPLGTRSSDSEEARLVRIATDVLAGLEHLHARSILHGDLKAANIVVSDSGRATLTDFGLARRSQDSSAPLAGSPMHFAPEVLLGSPADPRSDLFAFGSTLHGLLTPDRNEPREFHGRFPLANFFTASGTKPEQLPEWSRDLIARLVARDPSERFDSAARVSGAIRSRTGTLETPRTQLPVALRWPAAEGRVPWIAGRLRDLEPALRWWTLPAAESSRAFWLDATLRATLDGQSVVRVDLDEVSVKLLHSGAVDDWCSSLIRSAGRQPMLVHLSSASPWKRRVVRTLARAAAQAARGGRASGPIVVVAPAVLAAMREFALEPVPPVDEEALRAFLNRRFEPHEDLDTLAARLHAESSGSATRLQTLLDEVATSGSVVPGANDWRFAGRRIPDSLGRRPVGQHRGSFRKLSAEARRISGILCLLEDPVRLEPARRAAGVELEAIARTLEELADHLEVADESARGRTLRLREPVPRPADLALSAREWGGLHEGAARELERASATPIAALLHRFWGSPSELGFTRVANEARRLREEGCPELALEWLLKAHGWGARAAEWADRFDGEVALAWIATGELEPARPLVEQLRARDHTETTALAHFASGKMALQQLRHDEALEEFSRALSMGLDARGEALTAQAATLLEHRRLEEVRSLATTALDEEGVPPLPGSARRNLQMLVGLSDLYAGNIERARVGLLGVLQGCDPKGDRVVRAAASFNLATLERRAGSLEAALDFARSARELYGKAGHRSGWARAVSLCGGLQRDLGALIEAQTSLTRSLEVRERLGDVAGVAATRGTLALTLAARGHVAAAMAEARVALDQVRALAQPVQVEVLEATLTLLEARVGRSVDVSAPMEAVDPRSLVSRARAAWIRKDHGRAVELATAAEACSQSLGRDRPAAEARGILAALTESSRASDEAGPDGVVLAVVDRRRSGPGDADLARDLAERARGGGRDDRAARLFLVVTALAPDLQSRQEARQEARMAFERCARGLVATEREALATCLLERPDPYPEDLDLLSSDSEEPEDEDMDLLTLLDINRKLVDQEELPSLLGTIVDAALQVTGAERGFLALEEAGDLSLSLALHSRRGSIDRPEVEVSQSILHEALQRGGSLRLSNAGSDPLLGDAPSVNALELRSILCHAFDVEPGLRGVIYLDNRVTDGLFDERAERLLALLADQAALAIRQVCRLDRIRDLNERLGREVEHRENDLRAARRALDEVGATTYVGGLVGASAPMRRIHDLLRRLAPSEITILVCGDSGTGKELAARALHDLGPRAGEAFVSENCAALPESLIEAELFGYEKGAYTGATSARAGIFERAHGGTLFLDEIGELSLDLQAKLLRVLETRAVRRIGADVERPVDFRLIVATNRDLHGELAAERFREDLLYRLDQVRIEMPPLAQRISDIPLLIDHFLRLEERKSGMSRTCSPEVRERLAHRPWPGNVRELANEVARLCALSAGDLDDPSLVRDSRPLGTIRDTALTGTLAEIERRAILRAVDECDGDKTLAAQRLGISRAKIYQRLKSWSQDEV